MNRAIFVLCNLAVGLFLTACAGSSSLQPTPTPAPALAPTPTRTLEESNQEVKKQAQELALRLSGNNAIDCGEVEDSGHVANSEINTKIADYFPVNDCTLEAIQKNQAFRLHFFRKLAYFDLQSWIIGTPEGEIFLVFYETGWTGGSGPDAKRQCWEPQISTYDEVKYLVCKKNP